MAVQSLQTVRLAYGTAGQIARARALRSIETKERLPARISLLNIRSQDEALRFLQGGWTIIAYRGWQRRPILGEEFSRPYGGRPEDQERILREDFYARTIEEIRRKNFPNCPPRLASVFAAPSPAEAGKWGEVYLIALSLKEGASGPYFPLRWLDRGHYEDIMRRYGTIGGSRGTELDQSELDSIALYFSSQGNHERPADILIDPEQVRIFVEQKHIQSARRQIADIVQRIFMDDPGDFSVPKSLDALEWRLESYEDQKFFPELRKIAVKKLIGNILNDFPNTSSEDWFKRVANTFCLSGNNPTFLELMSIEECITEGNPFERDDPEYKTISDIITETKRKLRENLSRICLMVLANPNKIFGSDYGKKLEALQRQSLNMK